MHALCGVKPFNLNLRLLINKTLKTFQDVYRLARKVTKNVGLYDVPLKTFNHVDFLWAKDAPKLVYNKLISVIKQFPME